jgi:hypothetical protein
MGSCTQQKHIFSMAQIKRNGHLKIAGKRKGVVISSAGILCKESLTDKGRFLPASW